MSHTLTTKSGVVFIFNSDLSGCVEAFGIASDVRRIPGEALQELYAYVYVDGLETEIERLKEIIECLREGDKAALATATAEAREEAHAALKASLDEAWNETRRVQAELDKALNTAADKIADPLYRAALADRARLAEELRHAREEIAAWASGAKIQALVADEIETLRASLKTWEDRDRSAERSIAEARAEAEHWRQVALSRLA